MGDLEEKLNAVLSDPGAMEQIMALAQSLGGGSSGSSAGNPAPEQAKEGPDPFEGLDPELLQMGMRLLGEYQGANPGVTLLEALRPFLRPERQAKVDQAVRIARLGRAVRVAMAAMREREGREHV